ncbi:MAG: hypothetical protein HY744_16825 [Deltaproteobacteria bacterium]|nr:hypothetical protein [Deltaproteobacteria bacterium]
MSSWTKTNRATVDQRGEVLPSTWCPRAADGEAAPVAVNGAMRADSDRHLARTLCGAIDVATEMVVAASFLLADHDVEQALLRAARRRVRVYLLLATEARLEKEPREDSEFDQRALAEHEQMLGALAGWALIRSAPSFHAKVVLVDPAQGGRGFLLTANLTREALSRNEELAVELTTAESQVAFENLRWAMWEAAEHEMIEPGRLPVAPMPLKQVERPAARSDVVATLGQPGAIRTKAIALVRAAQRAITVVSFGWDADHEVVQAICARAREGVSVTVLARVRRAAMPALLALAKAGARVLGYPWLHAKAIAIDEGAVLVMSANLERRGLDDGFEVGVALDGPRAAGLREILRGWIAQARFELRLTPTLGEVTGEAQVWVDKKLVAFAVAPQAAVTLDNVIAASADDLESRAPRAAGKYGLPHPAHELEIAWDVDAPRLASKSRPLEAWRSDLPARSRALARSPGRSGPRRSWFTRDSDEQPSTATCLLALRACWHRRRQEHGRGAAKQASCAGPRDLPRPEEPAAQPARASRWRPARCGATCRR